MRRPRIVVLGMMSKMPVAGVVWQTVHYLVGLERLGYETYYVEAHGRTPSMFMERETDDGSALAARFVDAVARRFGFDGRWAFHALHDDGRVLGLGEAELRRVYDSAELLVNLHGGTLPRPEHADTGRLVYLETDPVQLQLELHGGWQPALDFLEPHVAFFSFGENFGAPDCSLPLSERFRFQPTRQPVVLDFWAGRPTTPRPVFTTIGNWRQDWRDVELDGRRYTWSKHHEFLRILDLPARTGSAFELALAAYTPEDRAVLEHAGWTVRDALPLSGDLDAYRDFVASSRGELTVAKEQNVRFRTGWFSDRSATYLGAGRPVVTQDTGFGSTLPTGEGLHAFSSLDEAAAAIERIESDPARHARAAEEIAREFFDAGTVLTALLDAVGLSPLPPGLRIVPVSRRPTRLDPKCERDVLGRAVPAVRAPAGPARASIAVLTLDGLPFTRLCLESVLRSTRQLPYELIVVDNGSTDGTRAFLAELAARNAHVSVLANDENVGFARGVNQALARSSGDVLVILNNDTIVPPGWLERLLRHLADPSIGLVGPVTNRSGNEAELDAGYDTYGELLALDARLAADRAGQTTEIGTATMFCTALRRETYELVGPLDESFGLGLLEDDDYSHRVRAAGLRVVCAEDVLVHHFGEASFGRLVPGGQYMQLLRENQERFARKWGERWQPYRTRLSPRYDALVERVRHAVHTTVPTGATVLVVSRGDDELIRFDGRRGSHFPQVAGGVYAGHYPADSGEAIGHLEQLRASGGDFLLIPDTGAWWLDHYSGLRDHLERRFPAPVRVDRTCVIFDLREPAGR